MYSKALLLSVAVVGLCFQPGSLLARGVPFWDVPELLEKSDVVVIVTHVKTSDARPGDPVAPPDDQADLQMLTPVVSTLKKIAVIKGELAAEAFLLPHYRFDWKKYGDQGIGNGPNLIVFEGKDSLEKDVPFSQYEIPRYMLFLKKQEDGMLVPVTGLFDPLYSLRELQLPKMDSLRSEYGKGF